MTLTRFDSLQALNEAYRRRRSAVLGSSSGTWSQRGGSTVGRYWKGETDRGHPKFGWTNSDDLVLAVVTTTDDDRDLKEWFLAD